jgi:iron complex transport system ATP-binding protein
MSVLKAEQLGLEVAGRRLLQAIDLDLKSGELLAVVGQNGAGKSTLLKLVAGEYARFEGRVSLCGKNLKDWPRQQLARHLAVLPQNSGLNFPYPVEDVVALGRIPHCSGRRVDRAIVVEVMAALDISYLRGRLYTELSGGEKQRTQLARVMAQIWRREDAEGRLLLLDEPTAALDLGHQQQLMACINNFRQQGAAVLMVVHDINIAASHADSILALECGHSFAKGTVQEVITAERMQRLFKARLSVLHNEDSGRPCVLSAVRVEWNALNKPSP